uniref:RNase H type-1 domain-containing protein n=1 Tax=Quercus lobata TaxID=97700 RepID=A0A7N2MJ41_QUELO
MRRKEDWVFQLKLRMHTLLRIELQPLATHWYKVNFDGVIFESVNSAGLGVVIRNCEGLVMASLSQLVHLRTMVIEEETLATRRALQLAIELGFDNLTLEGDSKVLIKVLESRTSSLGSVWISG